MHSKLKICKLNFLFPLLTELISHKNGVSFYKEHFCLKEKEEKRKKTANPSSAQIRVTSTS